MRFKEFIYKKFFIFEINYVIYIFFKKFKLIYVGLSLHEFKLVEKPTMDD